MAYKTILTHVTDDAAGRARAEAAADLAERFGAAVVGFAAAAQPAPMVAEGSAFAAGVWADQAREHDAAAKAAAAAFAEAMSRRGVTAEVRAVGGFEDTAGAAFGLSARYADLAVIGGRDAHGSRALADAVIDAALFEAGRPVLALPALGAASGLGRRPLLAWDGGPQAARAARDALPFLCAAQEVRVVVAKTYLGMAAHGEEPGADVARWLARHGPVVSAAVLEPGDGGVPAALAQEATRFGCDMIVMGGFGHSRLREAIFGGVTTELLSAPPLPLFLAH